MWVLYQGVQYAIYPSIIFMGIGAMTDFGPLLANPMSLLLGAAAQLGISRNRLPSMSIPISGVVSGTRKETSGRQAGHLPAADLPRRRLYDRLWSADCKPQELPDGCGGAARDLPRALWNQDRENQLLDLGNRTELLHLDHTLFFGGQRLHDRRLDDRDKRHIAIGCHGDGAQQFRRKLTGHKDSLLLLPIAFGMLLANLPFGEIIHMELFIPPEGADPSLYPIYYGRRGGGRLFFGRGRAFLRGCSLLFLIDRRKNDTFQCNEQIELYQYTK